MPNVFSLIGTAWDFYKSQPVLNAVLFWLMVLPMTALFFLSEFQATDPYFTEATWESILAGQTSPDILIVTVFLNIVLIIILLWGVASCTLVGKRLLQSRAGRARTSFKVVRKEAKCFIGNIFITSILRSCFTLFLALLLIVPGVIYHIRTVFYFIAIVCEGKSYRGALSHSKSVVKGHTGTVFLYILGLCIAIFLPIMVLDAVLVEILYRLDTRLLQVTYFASAYLYGLGITIFLLSMIALYANLKKVKPKA
jgi:uncharacterized membrane protein